ASEDRNAGLLCPITEKMLSSPIGPCARAATTTNSPNKQKILFMVLMFYLHYFDPAMFTQLVLLRHQKDQRRHQQDMRRRRQHSADHREHDWLHHVAAYPIAPKDRDQRKQRHRHRHQLWSQPLRRPGDHRLPQVSPRDRLPRITL